MGRVHLWQQAYVLRRQASVTTFLFEVSFWNRSGIVTELGAASHRFRALRVFVRTLSAPLACVCGRPSRESVTALMSRDLLPAARRLAWGVARRNVSP